MVAYKTRKLRLIRFWVWVGMYYYWLLMQGEIDPAYSDEIIKYVRGEDPPDLEEEYCFTIVEGEE